jgi:hypothetical protein
MLLFASAVLMVGRSGMARTAAAVEARKASWADRPNARPGDELSVTWSVSAGERQKTNNITYKGWVGGGGPNPSARSKHTVFAGSWDYRTVPFDPNRGIFTPHFAVLGKIATNGNSGIGQGLESTVGAFTGPLGSLLSNQTLLSAADHGNDGVRVAGGFLQYTLLPLLGGVGDFLDFLNLNPFADWDDEIDGINVFKDAVKNLVEAAHERPGSWLPDKLKKITNVLDF